MTQLLIGILGAAAIACTQLQGYEAYASLFGLASAPLWFQATWAARQWGMFALSWIYAGSWAYGFYRYWVMV